MRRILLVIPFLMILASCTPIKLIEPAPQKVGSAYIIHPTIAWNGLDNTMFPSISENWTADGFGLNGIDFWHDIENDKALYDHSGKEYPKFRKDMKATEVQELMVSSLTKAGAENVQATNLRPAKFSTADGFRFDMTYSATNGLHLRRMVLAAIVEEKLQIISYWGTEAHYFELHVDEVEKIMASVELI